VVDQPLQAAYGIELPVGVGHRLDGVEVRAPGEDRQPPKQRLLLGRQEIVAPGDGVAQRALSPRGVPRATREQRQALLEPRQHRLRRQDAHPGRG
jgi:hypothetical protein